ncbi:MAG TPA: MATE family efflux transporter, partial [Elusimicrobia bacterium]|nr:MATE family efflux transporter [Elusimicrobiota bacterium]
SRQVLFLIPLVLILPTFLGLTGVFLAPACADVISTFIAVKMLKAFFDKHGQNFFFSK